MLTRHESMSRKPRSIAENARALEATIMSCCVTVRRPVAQQAPARRREYCRALRNAHHKVQRTSPL
jgi:hypothetical protein